MEYYQKHFAYTVLSTCHSVACRLSSVFNRSELWLWFNCSRPNILVKIKVLWQIKALIHVFHIFSNQK